MENKGAKKGGKTGQLPSCVYRQEKKNPRMLVGTVEKVGKRGRAAFTNMEELWEIVDEGAGRANAKRAEVWERQKGRKPKQGTTETGDYGPKTNPYQPRIFRFPANM